MRRPENKSAMNCLTHTRFWIVLSLAVSVCGLQPQQVVAAEAIPGLFDQSTPLKLEVEGPFRDLSRDRDPEPIWRDATLKLSQGTKQSFSVRLKPRGRLRRRPDICEFPPLWFNFKRSEVAHSIFAGSNKLKLVTHCGRLGAKSVQYADRVHSEYLLYRIFNKISDLSFRVRAVDITYVDNSQSKGAARRYTQPGFFIEHKNTLAARHDGLLVKKRSMAVRELNAEYAAKASLFAFFAGNTDFSFLRSQGTENCCHNAVPLTSKGETYAVPYDFDSTGFVDPPYAAPSEDLDLLKVTSRLHRGYCAHSTSLPQAIEEFQTVRQETLSLIQDYPYLSNSRRKKLLRYSNKFFQILDNPKKTQRLLVNRCR